MLQYKRETLEGLSEVEQKHYKPIESGKGFVLDLDDKSDERVQGLIQNRNAALAEKDAVQAKLKAFDGLDAAAAKAAIDKASKLEERLAKAQKDGSSDEKVERIKADLKAEYDKVVNEKESRISALEEQFTKTLKEDAIKSALREAGVREAAVDMVTTYLNARIAVVRGDTGAMSTRVLKADGSGDFEVSTKDGSVYKTIPELIEDMKNDKMAFVFDGSKASGGGQPPNVNKDGTKPGSFGGNFANIAYRSDLQNTAQKSAFIQYLTDSVCGGDGAKAQKMYFDLPASRPA